MEFVLIVGGHHDGETIARDSLRRRSVSIAISPPPLSNPDIPAEPAPGESFKSAPRGYETYSLQSWAEQESGTYMECAAPVDMPDNDVLAMIMRRGLDRMLRRSKPKQDTGIALTPRQQEILARGEKLGKLEAYEALGVEFPPFEKWTAVERQALDDEDIKALVRHGLLAAHVATIREPPVWWTITDAGAAEAQRLGLVGGAVSSKSSS